MRYGAIAAFADSAVGAGRRHRVGRVHGGPDTAAGARELRRKESSDRLWRLFVAGFCAMQVMMLATPSYERGVGEIEPDLARLLD